MPGRGLARRGTGERVRPRRPGGWGSPDAGRTELLREAPRSWPHRAEPGLPGAPGAEQLPGGVKEWILRGDSSRSFPHPTHSPGPAAPGRPAGSPRAPAARSRRRPLRPSGASFCLSLTAPLSLLRPGSDVTVRRERGGQGAAIFLRGTMSAPSPLLSLLPPCCFGAEVVEPRLCSRALFP